MSDPTWVEVLDALYKMGGKGEYLSPEAEESLDSDFDLVSQTGLSRSEVQSGARRLRQMEFAVESTQAREDGSIHDLSLMDEGHRFAHNRQQEKRNIRSNRTVVLLTLVLAFVGMAQATALTATVSPTISGDISLSVTVLAGALLLAIFTISVYHYRGDWF